MTQKHHSVSVAAVVTDERGMVLVVKRRDNGAWQLPGGILELHETVEQGVTREVLEETGVVVRPIRLTGVYKNMRLGVVALVFQGEPIGGQPTPTDESSEVEYWSPEQVVGKMAPAFAVRITDALQGGPWPTVRHHDGVNLL